MYVQESSSYRQRRRTQSFSSSLLDAIYRSIDDSNDINTTEVEEAAAEYFCKNKEATLPQKQNKQNKQSKQDNSVLTGIKADALFSAEKKQSPNLQRAIMIDSWMAKQSTRHSNTTSSSSDPGSRGRIGSRLFSSSDSDSSSTNGIRRMKPEKLKIPNYTEAGFTKTTKLRAMKIYNELKKVKQPISPGGRIANFINSIFSSGNGKKVKICSISAMEDVRLDQTSKPANSYVPSKSSPVPSSRAKSTYTTSKSSGRSSSCDNNSTKRSVRFYPVSVIVGEDSRPCGHKSIYEQEDPRLMPKHVRKGKHNLRSSNYQIAKFDNSNGYRAFDENDSEYDDTDDNESCSSSDLFELDHVIGVGRYKEELPVYETTSLKTNKAIANGFVL